MAASKDILFCTPSGQLFRNKRTIPVTNIAELVTQRQVDHSKLSLSRVLIKIKRKIDLVEQEHESEHEESESSGDESEDEEPNIKEEPRIKDVLSHLSRAVPEKRASDLLHSMAASKDILFCTPSGQLFRNKRTIPVTNIAELVEYVLLPHNNEVTKPRALNTFLDGLSELGIDKG
ncbi:unnamed protein product [Porites evermanni]|uniref:Uncharacterized protein n=1 Tax=Porites evermanni TaxID=104178 RepID=A0ABN8MDG9_9CNID|nr:unnamed protein product [Porites evermanni]